MLSPMLYALSGTLFTFVMTAAGAACVFCFKDRPQAKLTKLSLGAAAGIMLAAAVWSLLLPAMEEAAALGLAPELPAAGGFILGVGFLMLLDSLTPHLHLNAAVPEGPHTALSRAALLFLAVTIHNIPEGMAVGISCAAAAGSNLEADPSFAVALGMGLQNVPEGAAVTLPLMAAGVKRAKAFGLGVLSGLAEPAAAVLTVLAAAGFSSILPWLLAFAAGAMLYVVVEELIPEARLGEHSNAGALAVLGGFVLMMSLDSILS